MNGQAPIDALTEEIRESEGIRADKYMQALIVAVQNVFSSNKLPASAKTFKTDKLSMGGQRIVIRISDSRNAMARLHASHQGIERTKRRAR